MNSSVRPRVLMLLENCPYPQDIRVRREATTLARAGYAVSVIAPSVAGQSWRETVDGVHVYRFPGPRGGQGIAGYLWEYSCSMAGAFLLSGRVFVERGFDVIHAHNPPDTFVFVAAVYKLFGKRFVFDHHDLAPEMYLARFDGNANRHMYRVLAGLEWLSCRLADRVIATNESYKKVEMARCGVPDSRISIVRNGPDAALLQPAPVDPELRRKASTIIGYLGAMGFQDGVDYLLRAIRCLVFDLGRTDVYCVLVGAGAAWEDLRALADRLEIGQYVEFTGVLPYPDWRPAITTADIAVVPDPSNGYNDRSTMIKVMEYMALGKPIVAFDLPEHRRSAGEACVYVRPNDELAFARALAALMDDPSRRAAMGAAGRRRVERELTWDRSARHLLEAYAQLGETRGGWTRKLHKVGHWLSLRDARYVGLRVVTLFRRYGFTPARAKRRVLDCVEALARYDCRPTFPTPGQVVHRNGEFCRELQRRGAELAVHGYQHLDFRALSAEESRRQFSRAAEAYRRQGIQFEGFRCPYLGYTESLDRTLPNGDFRYSSNKAVWWDVVAPGGGNGNGNGRRAVFEGLSRFYGAESSETQLAVPRMHGNLVEIPVCLPDDLQLLDGLELDEGAVGEAWLQVLGRTYRRGELFDLMFHPESFERCGPALEAVLREARALAPPVWIATLREIHRWWREKSAFTVEKTANAGRLRLEFRCSGRATVLVRNLDPGGPARPWYGSYRLVDGRSLELGPGEKPFVGVDGAAPPPFIACLRDQGYLLETGPDARSAALYLSASDLEHVRNPVELIDLIEASPAPLVRFWRWPEGARCALAVTGDLDALSLTDYGARVFAL